MPRKEYLGEFYTRPETEMGRALNKAVKRVGEVGVSRMDRTELKQVGLPIIREARARIRQLEEHGLTDSPAYQYIKTQGLNISTAGKDINTIRTNVMQAYNFLHTKTSTVEGASEYSRWLDEHIGADLATEEKEAIWDAVHRFEETHPQRFMNFGYDEMIKRISHMAKRVGYDADNIYAGLKELLEKEAKLDDTGFDPADAMRTAPWYRGRRSTDE